MAEMATTAATRIVTDSLAWIPAELANQHGITVVPLHVHFGDEQYTETVDLTNAEFYRRLQQSRVLPKTSQPAPGEFLEAYRRLAEQTSSILSIHASSKLSGTYRSAETAAGMLRSERPDVQIETIDTLQVAPAQGIIAVRAAEAAAAGASLAELAAAARALMPKPRILFVVETLEYLHKGGRIGRAQALLGGLLHVRPILTVVDGEVAPKERARTRARAMERVLDLMAEYAQGRPLAHVSVVHAVAEDVARSLATLIEQRFTLERPIIFTEVGPVIGTYIGPGAFGATFHCD
jgi:DegV family protein with EDD domain